MNNKNSRRVLSLNRDNLVRTVGVLMLTLAIALTVALAPAAVKAQNCKNVSAYTDYKYDPVSGKNKPILYIWNGMETPNPSKFRIVYFGGTYEWVPSPSDWGVRTDAPAVSHRDGGWWGYWIASRWLTEFPPVPKNNHYLWNDDWRWQVQKCA